MPDDTAFVTFMENTLEPGAGGAALSVGALAVMRQAFFEAHTMMLASLRDRVDRKDDDTPQKVPLPERMERLDRQRARLSGVPITGALEPAYSLIDHVFQQRHDEMLRYLAPEACISRQQELLATKTVKAEKADTSTELKIREALQRRSLAYDQLDIISYKVSEEWISWLFLLMAREPINGYIGISMAQALHADRQLFASMSEQCRSGLGKDASGARLVELAMVKAKQDPMVVTLLNPLPSHRQPPAPKAKSAPALVSVAKVVLKPKHKGKGKSKGTNINRMPRALIGLHSKTAAGEHVCFDANLNGCANARPGDRCNEGWHVCCKCLGPHSVKDCTQP